MSLAVAESLILGGHAVRAGQLLEQFVREEPGNAKALHLSALAAVAGGDLAAGIGRLRAAVELIPQPYWLRDLGAACVGAGRAAEAVEPLERALVSLAGDRELRLLLARALMGCGRGSEAVAILEALGNSEQDAQVLRTLGEALFASNLPVRALECLVKACSLDPRSVSGHVSCAGVALSLGRFELSLDHRRAVVELLPEDGPARNLLAHALWCAGEMEECSELSRENLALFPDDEQAQMNQVRAVDHTSFSAEESRGAWERWGAWTRRDVHPRAEKFVPGFDDPERVLRVGYLIDDIFRVPNAHFIPPLLQKHSITDFDVTCYFASCGNGTMDDLRNLGHRIFNATRLTPEEIAEQVRRDRIDILVNTSWDFRQRHLAVFVHRAAPLQIELPHYPATTGLTETDCILTDELICPAGSEAMYTETVRRLRNSYMGWAPLVEAEGGPAPIETNGYWTFGIFQKPAKLVGPFLNSVAEIMRRVPSARLLVHQNSVTLDEVGSEERRRLLREFGGRGVDGARLMFAGKREGADHLTTVAQCDIALDTFPYNGTTTTGDCLWMGVPVVTHAGRTHAGRVGLSMLGRVGLNELAGTTVEEYVEIAVGLAGDRARLRELRTGLRGRMRASVLTDAGAVMKETEGAFRELWRDRCGRLERN